MMVIRGDAVYPTHRPLCGDGWSCFLLPINNEVQYCEDSVASSEVRIWSTRSRTGSALIGPFLMCLTTAKRLLGYAPVDMTHE